MLELTKREIECVEMQAAQKSRRQIGAELGISRFTVKCHLQNARKRAAACRPDLAEAAKQFRDRRKLAVGI